MDSLGPPLWPNSGGLTFKRGLIDTSARVAPLGAAVFSNRRSIFERPFNLNIQKHSARAEIKLSIAAETANGKFNFVADCFELVIRFNKYLQRLYSF